MQFPLKSLITLERMLFIYSINQRYYGDSDIMETDPIASRG